MSMTFAAVIWGADDPCSVNTAYEPESSFTVSPRSTTLPLYFWYWGSSSEFLRWQRSINDGKWTFLHLFFASSITSYLFLTFVSCHAKIFSSFSHYFSTAAFASGFFLMLEASEWICAQDCNDLLIKFIHFAMMWSWWSLCPAPSSLGLVLSSASTIQAYFVLRVPILWWVSPLLFIGILQGIAAGIGTSNFLRAAFIVSLNSSSVGSMKNIPLNCLVLSSFGFSIAHLCFTFFFTASEIHFHVSGHTSSGREVFCFLVSLLPDHVYPSSGLSFRRTKSCESCPCIWQFYFSIHVPVIVSMFLHEYIQGCMSRSGNVDVLQRIRKWFFSWHVQFDSGFNVMTINEFSCNSPEVIFSFLIIPRWAVLKWSWRK